MAYLNRTTKQWQEIDTKHPLHPFTDYKSLAEEGSIIVTKADGVHLTTSDDKQLLDAMSGLWCVNVGYGRKNLAEVAYKHCLLYTSPSPRDGLLSRMPSSA